MKRFFFLLTALMSVLQAFADDAVAPKGIELTDSERQLVQNNNRFAFDLFSKVREAPSVSSFVLSPLSVTIDLSMLNNGADGVTRQEIDAVLGSETAGGADVLNSFCRKLLTESGNLDAATRVAMANNIYVNSALGVELLHLSRRQAGITMPYPRAATSPTARPAMPLTDGLPTGRRA